MPPLPNNVMFISIAYKLQSRMDIPVNSSIISNDVIVFFIHITSMA